MLTLNDMIHVWPMLLDELQLCMLNVMCLHIFMQLCYDWNSHPSGVMMLEWHRAD